MTKPPSMDLRDPAMARLDAGAPVGGVAAASSVAFLRVVTWSQRFRATGGVGSGRIGGHAPRRIRGKYADWLRPRMAEAAFTLRGPVARLAGRGLRVDDHRMWNIAPVEGLGQKKTALASEQDRGLCSR